MTDLKQTLPELIMLIGLPASGKSTLCGEYAEKGYQIHSSDAMRERLFGDESIQGDAGRVFGTLHREIKQDLAAGRSVVYDATNLHRKNRMAFLQEIRKIPCLKTAVLVLASPDVCRKRDASRSRQVGAGVIRRMLRSFQVPMLFEGFDQIRIVYDDEDPYVYDPAMARDFDQENAHHSLTLGAHMEAAGRIAREKGFSDLVIEAADFHDIGKLYTKVHRDMKGRETQEAHFYGHDSYGAYLYLVWRYGEAFRAGGGQVSEEDRERILHIAFLIAEHMAPGYVWDKSPKAREKALSLYGEETFQELLEIHLCDREAH